MKCNYCGKELNGENFCPNCGAANNTNQAFQNRQQNYQSPASPQFQQQNQYQNTYGSSPMVQVRSIATCIILSIVTCEFTVFSGSSHLPMIREHCLMTLPEPAAELLFYILSSPVASTDSTGRISREKESTLLAEQMVLLPQIRVWFILFLQSLD